MSLLREMMFACSPWMTPGSGLSPAVSMAGLQEVIGANEILRHFKTLYSIRPFGEGVEAQVLCLYNAYPPFAFSSNGGRLMLVSCLS